MKYFILAGEASGDLHSAALATALKECDAEAEIHGWGGDEMAKAGVKILKHYRELAFMGFIEVLQHVLRSCAISDRQKNRLSLSNRMY